MFDHTTAREMWTPTDLSNVVPLKTCAQVNMETTRDMVLRCSDEDLTELKARLRALYLVQLDRANDTLGDLMYANDESERRRFRREGIL